MELTTKPQDQQEKHDQYIDIHYLLEGSEMVGWALNQSDSQNDYALYDHVEGEVFILFSPEIFVILTPQDVHRPGLCQLEPAQIRNVVENINKVIFLKN